jgi:hypothetical protein
VLLALMAGLAGGVAMGAWQVARRTSTAFEAFVARADLPEFSVTFCPPGMTQVDDSTIATCTGYDPVAELGVISGLPEIEAAGRGGWRGLTLARPDDPEDRMVVGGLFARDQSLPGFDGRPLVVAGRLYDPAAPDEIVVNEYLAERAGIAVGDEVEATFWSRDELGRTTGSFSGPRLLVRVVGIVRNVQDIAARSGESSNVQLDESYVAGGPGLWRSTADASAFSGIMIQARNGDAAAARAAIEARFPDRIFNLAPFGGPDALTPIQEAIDYEAGGALAFAVLAGLAGAVFAGQAVARQARREGAELPAMRSTGLDRRQAMVAAALRSAVTGLGAVVVAVLIALALSPIGAIGVARLTQPEAGLRLDGIVLLVGAALVFAVVVTAGCAATARLLMNASVETGARTLPTPPARWSPVAAAGLNLAVNGRRRGTGLPVGAAVMGVALATGAVVAAAGLGASLNRLLATPQDFGVPWDLSVGDVSEDPTGYLADAAGVEAAAGIIGSDVDINGRTFWVMAFQPVPGVGATVAPAITSGREPVTPDEIALGALTMDQLGVGLGDTVEVASTTQTSAGTTSTLNVVGVALINDTYEGSPGLGGVVTEDWMDAFVPEVTSSADPYVLRLAPGTNVSVFRNDIETAFPGMVSGPVVQGAIRNVRRVAYLPYLLAGLVLVLATASLAHALVLSTRRQRRELAVLKTLGFRQGQVAAAVCWQATLLGVVALVIGLPLGVIAGRWGWRTVADRLGVASGPVVPIVALLAIVASALAIANLIAVVPGWRAARLGAAEALRVE